MNIESIIRTYFAAWESKDWNAVDHLLSRSFTFCSPNGDDHIPLAVFHQRCWLNQIPFIQRFDIERIATHGDEAFVRYTCHTPQGTTFHNVEHWHFANEKIQSIECFFGEQHSYPAASAANK